jgi:hypothetical protein
VTVGNSSFLLIEELKSLLEKVSKLFGLALDAQDSASSIQHMNALTWYMFNLKGFSDMLAMIAAALRTDAVGKSFSQFQRMAEPAETRDRHVTLYDLEIEQAFLKQEYDRIKLAYEESIRMSRPVNLMFNAADAKWKLLAMNLELARQA